MRKVLTRSSISSQKFPACPPAFGPAHPDVIVLDIHEPVEDGIAGKPENVIDAFARTSSSLPRGRNGYRRGW